MTERPLAELVALADELLGRWNELDLASRSFIIGYLNGGPDPAALSRLTDLIAEALVPPGQTGQGNGTHAPRANQDNGPAPCP